MTVSDLLFTVPSGYDWRKLAARMRLDFFIPLLHKRKGYSPTELLLQKWQIEGKVPLRTALKVTGACMRATHLLLRLSKQHEHIYTMYHERYTQFT